MDIPANLIQEVKRGNVVLFLGAGASIGATDGKGNGIHGVASLTQELSKRFLGGQVDDYPLAEVSELAISESDLVRVQEFVHDLFVDFEPANFHQNIPLYKWKSIYTTNYDLLIEKSYQNVLKKQQVLKPIYSSSDSLETVITSIDDLPYIKLHGCITKTDEDY